MTPLRALAQAEDQLHTLAGECAAMRAGTHPNRHLGYDAYMEWLIPVLHNVVHDIETARRAIETAVRSARHGQ